MLILQTPRLVLRDFGESDWSAIYALSREPAVTQYQTWLRLVTPTDAQRWVQNATFHNNLQPRRAYNLAVTHQGQVIGWIGWGHAEDRPPDHYDFGYALLPPYWGRGFMSEAHEAAVRYMFEVLDAGRVFGECASLNTGSARVMEKAGMTLCQAWMERNEATGAEEEHRRYAIDATDWRRTGETTAST